MSGGHYDFSYFQLEMLAEEIEKDFLNDGKYMTEDWSVEPQFPSFKKPLIEQDRIGDATAEERLVILAEIKSLIEDLKKCAKRAKELDWYMSGDTSAKTYLERLSNI